MTIYYHFKRVIFSKLVGSLSGFLLLTVAAKRLGSSTLGSFILFLSLFSIITLFSDVGIQEGLTKRLSERGNYEDSRLLGSAGGFVFITSAVVAVFIYALKPILNDYMGFAGGQYMIPLIFLDGSYKLFIYALRGEKKVGTAANIETAKLIIGRLSGVVLILMGWGIVGLIYSQFLGRFLGLLWGWKRQTTGIGLPKIESLVHILDYSIYSFVGSVGGKVFSWADTLLIGLFLSQSWVGIYEVAWRIAQVFSLISTSIAITIFPNISELASIDDTNNKIETIFTTVSPIPIILIVPAVFGSVVIGSELLAVAFDPEFSTGATALIILLIGRIVQNYHILIARVLQGLDLPEVTMRSRVVSIVINIILNIILIREFGIGGAAVATGLSILVNSVANYVHLRHYFRPALNYSVFGWVIMSSIFMYGVLELISWQLTVDPLYEVVIIILAGSSIYFAALLLSRDVRLLFTEFIKLE